MMHTMINSTINSSKTYKKWRLTIALEAESKRPLKCKHCRRSYKYKQSLDMHVKDAHFNRSLQTLPNVRYIQSINKRNQQESQRVRFNTVPTIATQYEPARRLSVIIQNPNAM